MLQHLTGEETICTPVRLFCYLDDLYNFTYGVFFVTITTITTRTKWEIN
jgi:hypothetical protein